MICPKCGRQAPEGMRFCESCGAPLAAPQYRTMTPAVFEVKRLAGSPLYLIAAIAVSAALLCNLYLAFAQGNGLLRELENQLYQLRTLAPELYADVYYAVATLLMRASVLRNEPTALTVIRQLPSMAVVTGLWVFYASAKNRAGRFSAAGLTFVQVVAVFQLVVTIGMWLLVTLAFVAARIAVGEIADIATGIFVVVGLMLLVAALLQILYRVKVVTTVSSVQGCVRTGAPYGHGSLYVAVLCFLSGGLNVISGIIATTQIWYPRLFTDLVSITARFAGAVASILFGVLILCYREKMNVRQSVPDTQPAPAQPAPAQPAPAQPVVVQPAQTQPAPAQPAPAHHDPVSCPARPAQEPSGAPAAPRYDAPAAPPQPAAQPAAQPRPFVPVEDLSQPTVYDGAQTDLFAPTQPVPETETLNVRPDTSVLKDQPRIPTLRLTRVRDDSVIVVDRAQFRLGRDPGVADYVIGGNTAVGRQHADIVCSGDSYSVVDLDSTNHTYVNGTQLPTRLAYPLRDGDELLLADEKFTVRIS